MSSKQQFLYLIIQRKSSEDGVQYRLLEKPTTKLTRAQAMLSCFDVRLDFSQDETDADVPEQSDYSTADMEKKRQIYEKALSEAKVQVEKLLADRSQKPKQDAQQAKKSSEKQPEGQQLTVKWESGRYGPDTKWVDIPMPPYERKSWWEEQ